MTRRAVVTLGVGQCLNWGVLYYAFAVLVLPLQRDLDVPTWTVTGAFSLSLLVSAAVSPAIGRLSDQGHAPLVMQAGGLAAAVLLVGWALAPGIATLYLAWAGIGACMAATLYEPAFAIVGRAHGDPSARLRALAIVTVFGGLASTIFLPATALLVDALQWRGAVLVLASIAGASACLLRAALGAGSLPGLRAPPGVLRDGPTRTPRAGFVLVVFAVTTLASAAFTTNLIPALAERAVSPTTAAWLGGLLGLMQLPGRTLLLRGTLADSPARLVTITFVLQAAGLACFALGPSLALVGLGIATFAVGAGMATLVRPHLVQTMFGIEGAGRLNGRVARWQQLARAAGPVLAAGSAAVGNYAMTFLVLSGAFLVFAALSHAALSGTIGCTRPGMPTG